MRNIHSVFSILQLACSLAAFLSHQRIAACSRQQQWLILCDCFAFSHAAVCDLLHRIVQVENEQDPGLHDVPPLLRVPDHQRDVRGPDHILSCVRLRSHICRHWWWIRARARS